MTGFNQQIRLIESARDAMQGLHAFIPTETKADYVQSLLHVGYDILDIGSFVSPKAIPQMRDTGEVIDKLDFSSSDTKLLVVVGNLKGIKMACQRSEISYFGFPFSISNTFLRLNINSNIEKSLNTIDGMLNICNRKSSKLMIYMSMAMGNPYNDPWSIELLEKYTDKLSDMGIEEINFSDTIGAGSPEIIGQIFDQIPARYPKINFGLHLHTKQSNAYKKLELAYDYGCRSFDSVLNGLGGCPMTGYEMVGNLDTLELFRFLEDQNIKLRINKDALAVSIEKATGIFSNIN